MEVENEPKKKNKAGKVGCIIAVIVVIILLIGFFSGIFDFREIDN